MEERMQQVVAEHEDELLQLPNVTGVGIGEKGGKQVIKVFVTRKVPLCELKPSEVVPRTLGGYETDIEEIGVVSAQTQ